MTRGMVSFPSLGFGVSEKSSGFDVGAVLDDANDVRPVHISEFVAVRVLRVRPQQVAEEPGVRRGDLLLAEVFAHGAVQRLLVGEPQGGAVGGCVPVSVVSGVAHGVHSTGSGCVCQDISETFSGLYRVSPFTTSNHQSNPRSGISTRVSMVSRMLTASGLSG